MARLRRLLDGGRPEAAVDAAAREDAMTRMAERMNDQINMLREENKSLLDQVGQGNGKWHSGEFLVDMFLVVP
jgi:hypothetical protein